MRRFDYYRASSVDQAVSLLKEHGEGGRLLAGGTDLLVQIKEAGLNPSYIVSLLEVDELQGLSSNGDGLRIGARALMREVAADATVQADYSALADGAGLVGSHQTRNMGTVGGNVCNAAPSADTSPPLSVLDASVHIAGAGGTREVAIDDFWTGPGRTVLAAADEADRKRLKVVAGTQRRHQAKYLQLMRRVHQGDIGDIVSGNVYWNGGELWSKPRQPEWSDMEWQLRNWLYFTWLSGDHITEQHVHNIDVANWAIGDHPISAMALAGRQVRTDPAFGNVFDHFSVEFVYPGDVRVTSNCRQINGCDNRVDEFIVGTRGRVSFGRGRIEGDTPFQFSGAFTNAYVQEHIDLFNAIRTGSELNEARTVAASTLTAIMGRMSAYTGQRVTWQQALNSTLDLAPVAYEFGPIPVRPVAVPGRTRLV